MKTKRNSIRFFSMILALFLMFGFTTQAFAATDFHKINGAVSQDGKARSYTSTTTKDCTRLTASGLTDASTTKVISVHVYYKNLFGLEILVASGSVPLDGNEYELIPQIQGYVYEPKTYIIRTGASSHGYELSTMFYE